MHSAYQIRLALWYSLKTLGFKMKLNTTLVIYYVQLFGFVYGNPASTCITNN